MTGIAEHVASLVDRRLRGRSGAVFYSGRAAFSGPSRIYILGLNPGGDPVGQADETVGSNVDTFLREPRGPWSAYCDESWAGRPPGTFRMQPRVKHLLARLGFDPRRVPASNVVFTRSAREVDLRSEKQDLLRLCWPVHEAVIERLGVEVVVCFGRTAGRWTREMLSADTLVGTFAEQNARRWRSFAHRDRGGRCVLTLTHPSIADWTAADTDPTPLVRAVLCPA